MELFEQMQAMGEKPDTVIMLSLLSACADCGDLDADRRFHRCVPEDAAGNVKPNEITFVAVHVACSHGGMVDKGCECDVVTCKYK
jgi:hypothetical protein